MMARPRLLTAAQVAELLAVSERTIRRWISEGRLAAYALSPGCLRFDEREILGVVRRSRRPALGAK
jgi:excisionase family DNA binding protein